MQQRTGNRRAPPFYLLFAEWRAIYEAGATAASVPFWHHLPRGDNHPVIVLPGLGLDDMSTNALRFFLKDRGYDAHGLNMGRNIGYRPGMRAMLDQRLHYVAEQTGRKVSLIGVSLGGTYARQMASDMPDLVRQVVTLGTATRGDPLSGHAWRLYEFLSGHPVAELRRQLADLKPVIPPLTAIYSRTDGVVPWQRCRQQPGATVENIEIHSSHYGLGCHPMALYAIADRLAQRDGDWSPFQRPEGVMAAAFPDPDRHMAQRGSPAAAKFS